MLAETTTEKSQTTAALNPSHIMQIGMGFWATKVLLSAVNLELFTLIACATAFICQRDKG